MFPLRASLRVIEFFALIHGEALQDLLLTGLSPFYKHDRQIALHRMKRGGGIDLNAAARLKVKGDTVYLPDPDGGVYFRNNSGSFHMTGSMMDRWIEKLFPVFTGEHTLEELTDGLPEPHRNRVSEIADTLLTNGFVRDVSEDAPHRLSAEVVRKFSSQIEFLDHLGGSGGHRFEKFRNANVLVVGSGSFVVSLVSALLETGLSKIAMLMLNPESSHRMRVAELAAHARQSDPDVMVEEIGVPHQEDIPWREVIAPYEWILYVSEEWDIGHLRALHAACRASQKTLFPAVFVRQTGMAGPLVSPDSDTCWESAWRRLHQAAITLDPQLHSVSSTAQAMLSNVIAFDLFKTVTGEDVSELREQLFLLNLETLEGRRHSFIPHPLMSAVQTKEAFQEYDRDLFVSAHKENSNGLLPFFSRLTSEETGIFHVWEEGDMKQLPLSLCRVQPVDPLSEGPAELLPELVCGGFTHEEARRESGLAGIEAYITRMGQQSPPFMGIGAGETVAEGICRGLQKGLVEELGKQLSIRRPVLFRTLLEEVQDDYCRFYLTALTTMRGAPTIAVGETVSGFPVLWAGTGGCWYGSVGLNQTLALRNTLLMALMKSQIDAENLAVHALEVSSVILADNEPLPIRIPSSAETEYSTRLQSAIRVLDASGRRLTVFELETEPFLKDQLAGVFGVTLRLEESL
ncbi:MAG: bacteriocin maturation protein [Cohnella sp.]|nr:bacteriocin maturation protein [Cohnella sp.]